MRIKANLALLTGVATVALGMTATPALASTHHVWNVRPGTGTISAAVAKAQPGDTIKLAKGTYRDSVFVPMTLTIRGAGWGDTVLRPPQTATSPCDSPGSMEGICVFNGTFDATGNPTVKSIVHNVSISGMRITGFSDSGVFGFATEGLHVFGVRADHNGGYGIARFESTDTVFEHNSASSNGEAGLYMGDSPEAHSVLRYNSADHNGFGLFMRDSTDMAAIGNTVWDNCIGILALSSGHGAPGDLPAGDYRIVGNTASGNDKACPASEGPAVSGIGIALAGVHDTLVANNEVRGNKPGGPSAFKGGIAIVSTKALGGTDPTNNTVRNNVAKRNVPADIFWDGSGSGNTVKHNDCRVAIPGNLGWCTDAN